MGAFPITEVLGVALKQEIAVKKPSLAFLLGSVCIAGAYALISPASASSDPVSQDEAPAASGIEDYTSRLLMLNQLPPRQNPAFKLGTRALNHRLIDQNRRGLGKVTDITIGQGGRLTSSQADIIATGFDQNLTFDVTAYNVTSESDVYSVTLTREQVQDNIPEFLAGIETAAGDDPAESVTLTSLVGARVQTSQGNQIAIVEDVLIEEKRKMAVALLLTLMGGSGKSTVAIPYSDARIGRVGSKATVEITEEQSRVVRAFAKKR